MMSTDPSGGVAEDKDLVLADRPADPEMRESTSVWLYEENGEFALPRIGIEAEAHSWDNRQYQANFAVRGGRVLDGKGVGAPPPARDEAGRPRILGAGPLTFRCIEPFRRWTMVYDGDAVDGTVEQQIAKSFGSGERARVRIEADMTMVTPPWIQDVPLDITGMTEVEAANALSMGLGFRFEHHFRAEGTFEIDGKSRPFRGTGTRIHRQSVRHTEGLPGHCWLSAVFPDGRAFGCLVYPPVAGSSEKFSYNDAVVYQDGRLHVARVVEAPMLRGYVAEGEDMSVTLESELGLTRIAGTGTLNTFMRDIPQLNDLSLNQGGALYRWDDQSAYGMVERSAMV